MSEWFYSRDAKKIGPLSTAELRQLVTTGQVRPDEFVWKDGMPDWVPARSVAELAGVPEAVAPTAVAPPVVVAPGLAPPPVASNIPPPSAVEPP